ncbi:MAG: class I SAM-dependent methyltransferase [Candidatus Sericytochromatia bacterium]
MTGPLISHVSDTAFWIAQLRANESARPDALFSDPLAATLAGTQGAEIAAGMPLAAMTAWSVVMRTCIIDGYIRDAIADGVETVLNLGAGLDTRPYRLELPPGLRWIEADFEHVIDYKQAKLQAQQPRCRLERVRIDLADRSARTAFFAEFDAQAGRILVITEGVVPYLSLDEAAALAQDLRLIRRLSGWLVDYDSPEVLRYRQRAMQHKMQKAPFRFCPQDWFGFFAKQGWRAKEVRYYTEVAEASGRPPPLPWYLRLLLKIGERVAPEQSRKQKQFAGYALMLPDTQAEP